MDPKQIASIWKAFQEVQEAKHKKESKLDPVDKDELKGKHSDRKDKDIDNDGDVDSSDEYLHNRRKAVSKAVKKDDKKDDVKEGKVKENDDEEEGEKEECPKCDGEGCEHCDGKGYHMAKKETYGKKKMKESNLFSDAELEAIEEKSKQPNDSGTKAEPFMSTNSAGEKKFYADHQNSDKAIEGQEAESELDGSKASKAVKSQAPKRRGENRKGDTAMPTPKVHPGQVGKDLKAGI